MKMDQAIDRACQEPTLAAALSWIAVWETDRAVAQALEWKRAGVSTASHGGGWDTCFLHLFEAVIRKHTDRVCAPDHVLLPQTRLEAQMMIVIGERFLKPKCESMVTGRFTVEADRFEIMPANQGPEVRFEILNGPDGDFIGMRVTPQSGGCAALTAYEESYEPKESA